MDIEAIRSEYNNLNAKLKKAVSTMELTDRVITIRDAIRDLQKLCPHNNGQYDFSHEDECPYCGKRFAG